METNNQRYELILGFATLVISFAAFKDDLKLINVNLGFIVFHLDDYFLTIVCSFGFCIYVYVLTRVARYSKKIGALKVIEIFEKLAFGIFVFILISPIILTIAYFIFIIFEKYTTLDEKQKSNLAATVSLILGLISVALSALTTVRYSRLKNKIRVARIEKEEITELSNAIKLYENGFYSQSIIEAFKVLDIHLRKIILRKGVYFPGENISFQHLLNFAVKYKLLNENEVGEFDEIKKMRNNAVHTNVELTPEQAKRALEIVKNLLNRTLKDKNEE